MKKIYIIGDGPAGVSAAIYAKRAGADVAIISAGNGALEKAEKIDNYYGFPKGVGGLELLENGRSQAKKLGIEIINEEVLAIDFENDFVITTKNNEYNGKAIIMATGSSRKTPKIDGLKKFEGAGVSYCAVCDGFFFKEKDVAVLGSLEYAFHEGEALKDICKNVYILTNGNEPIDEISKNFKVYKEKVVSLEGEGRLKKANFSSGEELEIEGLFIAEGVASSSDLARKIGVSTKDNKIIVDENMSTNINGIFAAGDCTPGIMQISKGIYEGSVAGLSAAKFIKG